MKHLTLAVLCLVASVFAISCKTQSGATNTEQSASEGSVKGNWVITDITFDGIPRGSKVTVFDEASVNCFKGSQWILPANNNGSYTLSSTDEGCNTATQSIVWSLYKQGGISSFQFKKVGSGVKAKNVTAGYRVDVASLTNTTMVWRAAVNFEGKTGYIVYTLQRS
ncbi:Lipocalin-like domain-containing protein [Chitinophaga sp. YR627]|uniref:lipocalin family protein n=1 Tax=Chitinophaga sp. YR627 TaxID=1881041 RepID=UPI0008EFB94E|nr:lipocalin family protein [Chitinophaga sp. YR627]SFN85468.1 Lipocalin-like domain-containing protein [Chitinophaga sp. YR627]